MVPDPTDLSCVQRAWPGMDANSARYVYSFSGGVTGTMIVDGGRDMYDNGNEMRLRVRGQWSAPLQYKQICDGTTSEPVGRGGATYATCKENRDGPGRFFSAAFHSDQGIIDGFRISGNLGADGRGGQTTPAAALFGTNGTRGFYKSVHDAYTAGIGSDPSVNHLVIARAAGTQTVGAGTDSDEDMIIFDRPVNHVLYILWAGYNGHEFAESVFQSVLNTMGSACFGVVPENAGYSPPPPPNSGCASRPCGPGSTCADFIRVPCIDRVWPPAGIPNIFPFTEGETGRSIRDGGSDMYDGGNYLSVRIQGAWQFELPYTQDCNGLFPTELDGVDGPATSNVLYSTCKLLDGGVRGSDYVGDVTAGTLFSASFYSAEAKIDGFLISGNLGADGGGSFESFHLEGPRGSHAYFKQVYGAQTDPSISHLIITRAPPDQLVEAPILAYTTDSDFHEVLFNTGQQVVMYMLWAGKLPSSIPGYDYAVSYRYTRQQVQVWPVNLPALYNFQGGVTGYYIDDGGRDAFDIGNELRIRVNGKWSSPLYYNQICDGSHSHPVGNSIASLGDVQYITCKLPLSSLSYYSPGFGAAFILIGSSKAGMIDGFMTLGNLGADKGGAQKFNNGNSPLRGPHGTIGYWKKTYGADDAGVDLADPSINHLIFGKGLDKADVTVGSSTDSDLHELQFKNGITQFYYILFLGKEGYSYSEKAFEETLNALASSCNLDEARSLPGGADEPPGMSGWVIAAIVISVWLLLCFLAGCFWAKKNGKLDAIMDKLPAIPLPSMSRAKTTPARRSAPSTSMAPLSTAKISLTTADSAAEEFATSYQPPSQ
ncbi:hypothetical protein Ctob_007133 [Chrysochromulina tobinii]|uniref:Uncharacterized protein n=1 Tax=Chrysochromulina tobinii TaxID=1460289 RepID=A0A0M0JSZ7_9EUKA|nr:hypothetical protein Ctob_007133 [Chrysochromulina tobinii]|eukprot:KOO29422.1 hypothetical protein Ctob_007133 [Chrysochromulina sp. CCMP291]